MSDKKEEEDKRKMYAPNNDEHYEQKQLTMCVKFQAQNRVSVLSKYVIAIWSIMPPFQVSIGPVSFVPHSKP